MVSITKVKETELRLIWSLLNYDSLPKPLIDNLKTTREKYKEIYTPELSLECGWLSAYVALNIRHDGNKGNTIFKSGTGNFNTKARHLEKWGIVEIKQYLAKYRSYDIHPLVYRLKKTEAVFRSVFLLFLKSKYGYYPFINSDYYQDSPFKKKLFEDFYSAISGKLKEDSIQFEQEANTLIFPELLQEYLENPKRFKNIMQQYNEYLHELGFKKEVALSLIQLSGSIQEFIYNLSTNQDIKTSKIKVAYALNNFVDIKIPQDFHEEYLDWKQKNTEKDKLNLRTISLS